MKLSIKSDGQTLPVALDSPRRVEVVAKRKRRGELALGESEFAGPGLVNGLRVAEHRLPWEEKWIR